MFNRLFLIYFKELINTWTHKTSLQCYNLVFEIFLLNVDNFCVKQRNEMSFKNVVKWLNYSYWKTLCSILRYFTFLTKYVNCDSKLYHALFVFSYSWSTLSFLPHIFTFINTRCICRSPFKISNPVKYSNVIYKANIHWRINFLNGWKKKKYH